MNQPSEKTTSQNSIGPVERSRNRTILFRIAALAVGLLLSLAIAEALVRFFHVEPPRLISKRQLTDLTNQEKITYYQC
ncbi:MAG TPA: hypothetical protein DDZ90_22970, partial [Planctomycetaceae bacterium]|nr:hypothetical protein [Planctomycetaceae bacterium]